MKIIAHGKAYHEIECPKCKAHLAYTNKETKTVDEYFEYDKSHYIRTYIECPECETYITLKLIINNEILDNGENIVRFNTGENTTGELC